MERLFREDETYTELGSDVWTEVSNFAEQLLGKYPDVATRDLLTIAHDALDMKFVFTRAKRVLEERKRLANESGQD